MKLYAMTMSYNRPFLIQRSLEFFYDNCGERPDAHFILDQRYPLPSAEYNTLFLRDFCKQHEMFYLNGPGKNLGYHEGINYVANLEVLHDEDILLNYDPDSMPLTRGWVSAIKKAFTLDPSLAVVELVSQVIHNELNERGCDKRNLDGLEVWYTHRAITMSIVAWNVGFIRKVGGLKEPCELYGGVEAEMDPIIRREGKKWGVLVHYAETPELGRFADPEYTDWKRLHGHERSFKGDFDSYLRSIGRIK